MQRQEPAPGPHDIEAAPPAYSPQPAEGHEGTPVGSAPGPVKGLPPDVDVAQKQMPAMPVAPEQRHEPVPGVTPLNQLVGTQPQWIDCPYCQRRTLTRVNKEGTPMQVVAGVLCCLVCVLLACVPCLAGWFEETNYFCSQCHNKVAKRPENGPVIVYGPGAVVPSKYVKT